MSSLALPSKAFSRSTPLRRRLPGHRAFQWTRPTQSRTVGTPPQPPPPGHGGPICLRQPWTGLSPSTTRISSEPSPLRPTPRCPGSRPRSGAGFWKRPTPKPASAGWSHSPWRLSQRQPGSDDHFPGHGGSRNPAPVSGVTPRCGRGSTPWLNVTPLWSPSKARLLASRLGRDQSGCLPGFINRSCL